jgi:hypothetical protein
MKHTVFISLMICIVTANLANSQTTPDSLQKAPKQDLSPGSTYDPGFKEALIPTLQSFDSAKVFPEMMAATNRFGLIAKKWDHTWAAQYYAGYSLIVLSYVEKEQKNKDPYLDEAEKFLNSAWTLTKTDSTEMYVLAAMLANARLAVMPAARFKKFGDLFNSNIEKAKKYWAENPRIYYLQGTSVFYTPKMFGGGASNALLYFEKAETYFQNEKVTDIVKPHWGRKQNLDMIVQCKKEIK